MDSGCPLSILYVDDEPALLEIAKVYMERQGYEVTVCESAAEALELLNRKTFDAIISDYQMPGMDGISFLASLRGRDDCTPFIIFTGKDREDVVIDALNMGADFYVKKGGDPRAQFAELLNMVEYAVRDRKQMGDLERSEELFQRALSIIPDMVSLHDRDMNILYSNWKGFGVIPEKDRVLKTKCYRTYRGYDDVCPDCQAIKVLETGEPFEMEAKIEEGGWIDLRVMPLLDKDGEVEMFLEWVRDINTLKEVETKLRRESENLKHLLDAVGGGGWEFDLVSEIAHTDGLFSRLLGYEADEMKTISYDFFKDMVHPDDVAAIDAAIRDLVAGDAPRFECDYRIRHKEGHWVWMRGLGTMDLNEDGVQSSVMRGINIDITDIKSKEEELQAQNHLIESMMDGVQDIIAIQLPDRTLERYNRAGYEALGVSMEDAHGKKCYELLGRAEACDNCASAAALQRQAPVEMERYVPELGKHLLCRSTPLFNDDGEIIRVAQHLRDVSESRAGSEANGQGEDEYRTLLESTVDVIWSLDQDMRIRYISPAIGRIGGYDSDEMQGGRFLDFIHPNDEAVLEDTVAKILDRSVESAEIEFRVQSSEEEWLWTSNTITLLSGNNGSAIGPIGVCRDINDKKRAEEALMKAREQLSLLSSITRHDIINKALAARGYLDLLKESEMDDLSKEMLENVDHSMECIVSSIDFFQNFKELGSKKPHWIGLCEMLESLSARVDLTINAECEEVEIFADKMLYKVFENLLENILSYSGVSSATVGAYRDGGSLVLYLEDEGVGVRDEDKERIFDRGYGENTGMGLHLAKEILAITDIKIRETGIPGEGAIFEIVIPRRIHRGFVGNGR